MPEKIKISLLIFSILQFLLDLYIFKNWKKFILQKKWSNSYYQFYLAVSIILLPLSIYTANYHFNNPVRDTFHSYLLMFVNIWWISKIPSVLSLLLKDIISLFIKKKKPKETSFEKRRDFLVSTGWTLAAVPYLITTNGALNTKNDIKVKTISVPILNLHPDLHNTWIAQISDLHLGSFFDDKLMSRTIDKINSLGADMVMITGDFVNYDHREYEKFYKLMKKFSKMKNVFACLGNHDHYVSSKYIGDLKDMINSSGIDLLINESRVFEKNKGRLNIAGIDNIGHGQNYGDFNKTFLNVDNAFNTILLAHDPRNWDQSIISKRYADLTLSGHTHGGQLVFEFMNERFSPVQFIYKQWAGLYTNTEQHIYVNTGLGTVGPPIRIGVAPEITMIRLVPSNVLT
ncbi:metallophosphoesterase [Candidatus Kapabacteria bacterium]|nr:metallophosphoesterase [Candidatus Kapabacteria bacterium]